MENELEITKVVKSDRIETVDSRGGKRTKMPSTVSLVVDHRFANEAQELLMDLKEGKTADHGLIGMELVAVYAQPKPEEDLGLRLANTTNELAKVTEENLEKKASESAEDTQDET